MWRWHLFEIEDFSWFPKVLRDGQTDYLRFITHLFSIYKTAIPKLVDLIKQSGETRIVDLCSGGGGSMLLVDEYLKNQGVAIERITLTDLYPNIDSFSYLSAETGGRIGFEENPVNALDVPKHLVGIRTFFNSFHHLRPDEAVSALKDAVDKKVPIGIFEPMEKSFLQLLTNLLVTSIVCLVFTPFIRPFKFSRLVFTYLIPLIPIITTWDGIVSLLRLYSPKHLDYLVSQLPTNNYYWESGYASHTFGKTTYLIGYPID